MDEERVQRRFAAILAVDVVGYSCFMEQEEASMGAFTIGRSDKGFEPIPETVFASIVISFCWRYASMYCAYGCSKSASTRWERSAQAIPVYFDNTKQ